MSGIKDVEAPPGSTPAFGEARHQLQKAQEGQTLSQGHPQGPAKEVDAQSYGQSSPKGFCPGGKSYGHSAQGKLCKQGEKDSPNGVTEGKGSSPQGKKNIERPKEGETESQTVAGLGQKAKKEEALEVPFRGNPLAQLVGHEGGEARED